MLRISVGQVLLPFLHSPHSMMVFILFQVAVVSGLLAYFCNGLALRPWRRAKDQHWSERARLFNPARGAATVNLWVLPAVITMSVQLFWPEISPPWILVTYAGALGTLIGTLPMDREVFPRITGPELIRQCLTGWVIRFFMWGVFLGAIVLMPPQFNLTALIITLTVIGLLLWWSQDGWIYVGRKLHLFVLAPERLHHIVAETAAKMNIPYRNVWLMRTHLAMAYALPTSRQLVISSRILEILDDTEISTVCAHELGHLSETKGDYLPRYLTWLMFLPWIYLTPALQHLGMAGFFLLLFITLFVPFLVKRISHRLEVRADAIAYANEANPGDYARALTRLYEDNLLPAENSLKQNTHPSLYDRLIAAGVTPDFPRPAAAQSLAPHGTVFSGALGLLAVLTVERLLAAH